MLARTLQFLCGLVLLSVGGLQAQVKVSGQQLYKTYGVEHGLENLTVGSIVQDPFGFIWVSTEGGVFRFDGKRFSEFGLKDGLPTVSATTLHVAPDGTLWCGTFQGLCRYDQGRFIAVTESEGLSPDRVIALASGHDGHLLVATTHGLFEQGENGKFRLVEEVPSKLIAALHVSRKGGIIVAVWDKQVSSFYEKPLGASWRELEAKVDRTMRKATVHALGDDSEGALWARSTEHVWRKGPDEDGFVEMLKGQAATPIKATLGVDSQGRILAPTPQGVFRYEKGQWTSLGRLEGMPRNHIVAILEDREGSIWMGGLGLSRVRGGGIFKSYTKQDGLPSDTVWKIARDDWGNLYAGTEAGLARWENGRWNLVKGTGNICVLTLSRTPSGELMGATWPARLFIIQRNGSLRWISMATARLGSTGLPTALMDRQGSIWVGSITEGLQKGEKRGSQWIFEPVILPGGRKDERITCVIEDREGRLWVAGNSGLRIKDGGAWHHLTRKNGLRDDSIEGLTCASNGDVIISYSEPHGLARTRFSSQEGFRIVEHLDRWVPSNKTVYFFSEDAKGNFWVGLATGLVMIDSSGRVQRFASAEGVISEDVNAMAILPEANGDVWFGTGGGLVQFLSSMYRGLPKPPYTALLDCKLGDTSYPIQTHMPKVPKADGTFRAQFAGLTYIQEGSIAYQVRLEGLDADWRPNETREERYASLSAGKYRFDVRSRIGEGDWGPISSFEFEVLPAWWETWWFRLLALLGGAGLITILSRWRMSHLRHRNERLRAIVALRTREVEAKAEELLVANEALRNQSLTDPLTGLRNRRYLWVCLPEDVAQVKRVNHSLATDAVDRLLLNVDLAFFMVDIDYFKDVNDNHGHMAGDRVLQQVGEILKRVTRDTDTVVRWGGEEFLVVARNTARREATVLAERIRSEIERHVFTLGEGSKLYRCCSIGFSFYPFMPNQPNLFTWEQCLEIADRCLYAAKRGGRNAWVGLAASQDADVEGLKHSVPVNIPRALQSGDVEVVTSISDDVTLQWGEPR